MKKFALTVWALVGVLFLLNGCFLGNNASASGSSWTPYLVLKTKSTAAMEVATNAYNLKFKKTHSWLQSFTSEAYAATVGSPQCPGIGTILGSDGNAVGQNGYAASSCTGVLYDITPDGFTKRLQNGATIWYDGAGCTGNAYVTTDGVGGNAVSNGGFFTVDPTVNPAGSGHEGTYLMVKPGSTAQSVTLISGYTEGVSACSDFGTGLVVNRFAAVANDPTVTGMQSAQVAGGVTASTP